MGPTSEHATHATTHATTGVTALLQPAQNTQTLHDSIRGTEHARARGIEDGLGVGGLDGGGDVSNVKIRDTCEACCVVRKLRGVAVCVQKHRSKTPVGAG
jgi:hypothetical protein